MRERISLAHSGRILARIAELLDHPEDAAHYREVSEKAAQAFRLVATEDGAIHSERQADYLRPIAFGLLTENETKAAAAELDRKIAANGYHLNTGFLSTPLLCQVLADYGHLETAYRLLLQDTMPSWLYAVKRGGYDHLGALGRHRSERPSARIAQPLFLWSGVRVVILRCLRHPGRGQYSHDPSAALSGIGIRPCALPFAIG